ncbi:bifunctional diguanylate cyclase/phosphodiesterase [Actinoplanes sp. LDG1-06]|uniref:Bifunctional diguanylate cyclase/phosphodiesterase n=1 Tax=Paractinoplanes ovalisporus TaxID=2810368 RepID=A0ABS2AK64_9ACTN|nr:bifunctional diguanylate cyclase/phosphodiesterase [Actinoplanes ovalisporus]MBM2619624.1 bifunctional diguanylate cyclase/phosphodiesterase [Actinoplanes ovalisporus]
MPGQRGWWWWLLIVVPAMLVSSALPVSGQLAVSAVLGAGFTGAILLGVRLHRPARSREWRLLALAAACGTVATALWAAEGLTGSLTVNGLGVVDILFFAGYPPLAVGIARLPERTVTSRWAGLTETAIVLCTGTVLAWVLLYDPYVLDRDVEPAVPAVVAYPFLDAVIIGLAIRLLIVQSRVGGAHLAVLAAATVLTASDVRYFLEVTSLDETTGTTLSTAGWTIAFTLISVAALHPSVARTDPGPDAVVRTWRVLALYVVLVLIGPFAAVYSMLRDHRAGELGLDDLAVPLTLTGAVSVLLVVRMALATHLAEQQTATLKQSLTGQAALQESMRHMVLHDTLTGLPNRRKLEEQLTGEGTLLLLDLDGFKEVNDRLGHTIGDQLLVAVAGRLRTLLRPGELLARPGGDEFAVLIRDDAPARAEGILDALRDPIEVSGHTLHVTGSIGVRRLEPGAGPDELLSDVDLALYAAKADGKDRCREFDPRLRHEQAERFRTVERLRAGLAAEEFTVHYQPIVRMRGDATAGFEALVRWTPPGQDPIGPDRFIPAAENSGLIVGLGEWVLRRACLDAAPWWHTYGANISVNVSPRQLAEHDFTDVVRGALNAAGLPAAALVLEITEGVLVRSGGHAELTLAHLAALRAEGVRVAIDDFGTGYSSLAYLRDLPIDILKIDKSFMPDDATDAQQAAMVRAVVDLARSLRLVTVAEGVETAQHAELLRTLGCDKGQGWLFGRPGPAAAASDRLASEAAVTVS